MENTDRILAHDVLIADRRTHTEEGQRISEWEIRAEDVREFVRRRAPATTALRK